MGNNVAIANKHFKKIYDSSVRIRLGVVPTGSVVLVRIDEETPALYNLLVVSSRDGSKTRVVCGTPDDTSDFGAWMLPNSTLVVMMKPHNPGEDITAILLAKQLETAKNSCVPDPASVPREITMQDRDMLNTPNANRMRESKVGKITMFE